MAEHSPDDVRRQNLRLEAALRDMSQGVCMFDKDQRLIICNARYAELFGLAMERMTPGTTLRQIMAMRIAAGTYGLGEPDAFIQSRLRVVAENKPEKSLFELKDGRVFAVAHQPTSDGGWVATFEDISDRIYAEGELARTRAVLSEARAEAERAAQEARAMHDRREASFRFLFDSHPLPMWVWDHSTFRYLAVNDAALEYYGYARERFLTLTVYDIMFPGDRDVISAAAQNEEGSRRLHRTMRHVKSDGSVRSVSVFSRTLLYDGRLATLATAIDITEQKQAQDELRQTRIFLDAVVENVPAGIVVKNSHDLRYILINRATEELYGLGRADVIGKTAYDIYPEATADIVTADHAQTLAAGHSQLELEVQTPRNGARFVAAKSLPIVDENGAPQYLLTVIDDVTERKQAERSLAHLAHHDPLTDLPNRAAFGEHLAETIRRAAAGGTTFAVLCADLDYFKQVNDLFGHAVGDELLCEVSRRLQAATNGAFLARIGGDEFMLISAVGEPIAGTRSLAEQLIAATADPFKIRDHELCVGLSVGIAVYPKDGVDAIALLANADAALYRVKAEGRLGVQFFQSDMDKRIRQRHSLQHDLRSAIARNELLLHYQPQATIDGKIFGFEALIRWNHPQHGLVSPESFISLAEENGLIVQIGEWVLREACREAASWRLPLQVGINLSPVQFRRGDLPALVHAILFETGLHAGRLEFEITEGVIINDLPRALSILRRLKALGAKIAMDDFGTGYSSLAALKSFPFDKIKIDKTFISGVEKNEQSATIVRAIIGLGRGLDIAVIAEGVETEDERRFLLAEKCDEIQGYLIGRPSPIADYADIINGRVPAAKAALG